MAKSKAPPKTRKEGPTKCWRRTGGKGGTYLTCAESSRPGAPQLRKGSKPKMVRRKPKGARKLLIVDDVPAKRAAAKKPAAKGRSPAQKAARKDKGYESRAAYMKAYRARKKAGK